VRLIDTHCHLNKESLFGVAGELLKEASEAGVERVVVVGVDDAWNCRALTLAERYAEVFAVVGWHPTSAAQFSAAALDVVTEQLKHPRVVAIGEIGLDYHWPDATRDQQFGALRDQLDLARRTEKPVVFHCREAYPDLLDELERHGPGPYLFHCFAGDATDARRALALGGMFGVDGPLTYPKADALRAIIKDLPRDHVVLETDTPYMAPHPYRSRPNTPAMLRFINAQLAALWDLSPEQSAEITTANAERFFGLPATVTPW